MNTLEAKVDATNRANASANKLQPALIEIFRPFVGQKILKADGTIAQRFQRFVPKFSYSTEHNVYHNNNRCSWTVKCCSFIEGGGCVYHEAHLSVGRIVDGVLTELATPFVRRADWTAEEVQRLQKAVEDAETVFRNAQAALEHFPRY